MTVPTGLERLAPLFLRKPAYAGALAAVWTAVWDQDVVDVATLELCRLRVGQLLGADPQAERIDGDWLASLPRWPTDPRFDERVRTAIEFAEQLLMDAQGVDDDLATRVVREFGEDGFLVLIYACGLFETTQRAQLVTGLLPTSAAGRTTVAR